MKRVVEDSSLREKLYVFKDRWDAGVKLARALEGFVKQGDLVLAIPAGGVPIGIEVSRRHGLELDVAIVRKVLFPWTTEAGFGAVSWNGKVYLNHYAVEVYNLSRRVVEVKVEEARRSVERRLKELRVGRPPLNLKDRRVVLVDDGLASGFTMLAAAETCRSQGASWLCIATPTASLNAIELLEPSAELVVVLNVRSGLSFAVADAYEEWRDLKDEEVLKLLHNFWRERSSL